MFRQNVDLAARFSAVILRDEGGEVLDQWDSRGLSAFAFAAKIGRTAKDPQCDATYVEDVPYGVKNSSVLKPVYRFQGAIMLACNQSIDRLWFMVPTTWMKMFPGVERRPKGMTQAEGDRHRFALMAQYAKELGYEPPDLIEQWRQENPGAKELKKITDPLAKSMTDYVAAFLISEFTRGRPVEELAALQGVQVPAI